jgi:hypothetical protein
MQATGGQSVAVSARAVVPLRDQRRNCDHTRVQGPNDTRAGVGDVEHRVHYAPQVR